MIKLIKNFWLAVKPAVRRFPAAFFLILLSSALLVICICSDWDCSKTLSWAIAAACWGVPLCLFVSLLFEAIAKTKQQTGGRIFFILQSASLVPCVGAYFLCKTETSRAAMILVCLSLSFVALSIYLLKYSQKQKHIIPNILVSWIIGNIVGVCLWAGLSVIIFALQTLFFGDAYSFHKLYLCAGVLAGAVQCYFFIAYASKPEENVSLPKAFLKVLLLYVLFPLYIVLLLLLYVYLLKSLVTLAMPQGEINWFVSFATAFYMLFYFMLSDYKNRVTNFFYKRGAFALLPLIAVQCVAFGIRIYHYGYTVPRYASLLYILFSVAFCIAALVKRGRHIGLAFPAFAALMLFGSLTPLNFIDVPFRSQNSRIIAVLAKYDMFSEGRLVNLGNEENISNEDKEKIASAFAVVVRSKDREPEWLAAAKKEFTDEQLSFLFDVPPKAVVGNQTVSITYGAASVKIDVSQFTELYASFTCRLDEDENRITVRFGDDKKELDITQSIVELLAKYPELVKNGGVMNPPRSSQPLVLKAGGYVLFIQEMRLGIQKEESGENPEPVFVYADISGLIAR